jgi:ABC-type multidrug transport system fused ATPase/permease subunit
MYRNLKRLLEIIPASPGKLLLILILFIITSVLEVFGIGVIGPFFSIANNPSLIHQNAILTKLYDISNIQQERQFVAFIGLLVMIAFIIKTIGVWFTQIYIVKFSDKQQSLLLVRMAQEYLYASYVYHTKKNTASILSSITEVSYKFNNNILNPLLTTIANIIVAISLFFLLCATSLPLMVGLLAVLLPVFIFFDSFKGKVSLWGQETIDSKRSIVKIVNHAFGGIKETKVIGCESYFEGKVKFHAKRLERSHEKFAAFKMLPRYVTECAMVLTVVAIFSISLFWGIFKTENLTAVLGVFALASIRLLPAVSNTIVGINQLINSSYLFEKIYAEMIELRDFKKEEEKSIKKIKSNSVQSPKILDIPIDNELSFTRAIELSNVTYCYPNAKAHAVSGISLTIKKGESIAFIGKSGAGKTTLVDVILGLLMLQKGDITVDGTSIYKNLRAWQNMIGYIPQSIFLTDETLENNIAFGVPPKQVDQERLWKAVQAAQLTEVVEKLPNGLQTVIGERGILLSGGQRQRVGIARALYHGREILVLDEATAALDHETEQLVTDSIRSLMGQRTIILIAHRLTTVKDCKRIYRLESGQIKDAGSYEKVVLGVESM